MPTFVVLAQFTDQGLRTIREFPQRARENMERVQAAGISIKAAYLTEGEYDQVIIIEAPDEELGVGAILALMGQGNLRTHTLRAHAPDEVSRIVTRLPTS